jgi:hypothetical protein
MPDENLIKEIYYFFFILDDDFLSLIIHQVTNIIPKIGNEEIKI